MEWSRGKAGRAALAKLSVALGATDPALRRRGVVRLGPALSHGRDTLP